MVKFKMKALKRTRMDVFHVDKSYNPLKKDAPKNSVKNKFTHTRIHTQYTCRSNRKEKQAKPESYRQTLIHFS